MVHWRPAEPHSVCEPRRVPPTLNGIDVVVGRGRDQGHAGLRAAHAGNVRRHLLAGQLATLACRNEGSRGQAGG